MALAEKYVRADAGGSGDGSADNSNDAWTLAQALAGYAAGDRINIRAGSYTLSSSATPTTDGTVTSPVVWRGFYDAPGDLDYLPRNRSTLRLDPSLLGSGYAFPLIEMTSYSLNFSGASYSVFANLKFTSTTGQLNVNSIGNTAHQLVVESSGVVASDGHNLGAATFHSDFISAGAESTDRAVALLGAHSIIAGCFIKSSGHGIFTNALGGIILNNLIIAAEQGIRDTYTSTTNPSVCVIGNTIVSANAHGVQPGAGEGGAYPHVVAYNHITDCGTYGVLSGYAATGERNGVFIGNRFRDNSTANLDGYDDWAAATSFAQVTDDDSTAEFVDYANDNLRLVPGAAAIGKGLMFHTIGALPDLGLRGRVTLIGGLG